MTPSLGVTIGAIPSLADADPVSASNADDSAKTISKARFMKSPPDRISAIGDTISRDLNCSSGAPLTGTMRGAGRSNASSASAAMQVPTALNCWSSMVSNT